jgi:lysophospholipase L1-like esterase
MPARRRLTVTLAATLVVGAAGALTATAVTGPTNKTTACEAIRIMPLGDSITEGEDNDSPQPVMPDNSYRGWLHKRLQTEGYSFDLVGSHGKVMDTFPPELYDTFTFSYQGSYDLPTDMDMEGKKGYQAGRPAAEVGYQDAMVAQMLDLDLPRYKPNVVLVLLGTNDLFGGGTKHGKWTNEESTQNVLGVVDKVTTLLPNTKVYVAPNGKNGVTTTAYDQTGADGKTFNQRLQAGVAARSAAGKNVAWVNIWDQFAPTPAGASQSTDMNFGLVHPNISGHHKMADAWYNAIKGDLTCKLGGGSPTTSTSTTAPINTVPPSSTTTVAPSSAIANTSRRCRSFRRRPRWVRRPPLRQTQALGSALRTRAATASSCSATAPVISGHQR